MHVCVDADPDSPSDLMEKHVRVSPTRLLIIKKVMSDGWKREDQLCSSKPVTSAAPLYDIF